MVGEAVPATTAQVAGSIPSSFEERQLYAVRTQLGATMEAEHDCPWALVSFLLGCVLSSSASEGHCPSMAGGRVPADSWCSSRTSSSRLQDPHECLSQERCTRDSLAQSDLRTNCRGV